MSHAERLKQDPDRVQTLARDTFVDVFAAAVPQLVDLADPGSVALVAGHSEVDALKGLVKEGLAMVYAAADEHDSHE